LHNLRQQTNRKSRYWPKRRRTRGRIRLAMQRKRRSRWSTQSDLSMTTCSLHHS
jgi:hypothetical protein